MLHGMGGKEWEKALLLASSLKELAAAALLSLVIGVPSGLAALLLTGNERMGVALAISLVISLLMGMASGTVFTILSQREKGFLRFFQTRLSLVLMNVITVPLYVLISRTLASPLR